MRETQKRSQYRRELGTHKNTSYLAWSSAMLLGCVCVWVAYVRRKRMAWWWSCVKKEFIWIHVDRKANSLFEHLVTKIVRMKTEDFVEKASSSKPVLLLSLISQSASCCCLARKSVSVHSSFVHECVLPFDPL